MPQDKTSVLIIFLLLVPVIFFACGDPNHNHKHKHNHDHVLKLTKKQKAQGYKFAELTIMGMTCSGCSKKIEKNLQETSGIIKAHIDHTKSEHNTEIIYNSKQITHEKIKQIITNLGYTIKN